MATQNGIGGGRWQKADRTAAAVIVMIGALLVACGGDEKPARTYVERPDAGSTGGWTGAAPGTGGAVGAGTGGVVATGTGGVVAMGAGGNVVAGAGGGAVMGIGGAMVAGTGGVVAPGTGGVVAAGTGGTGGTEVADAGDTTDAGADGVVATGAGGATAGTGGATGTGGTSGAVAKFCHDLQTVDGEDVVLTVVIGSVNPVQLSASTGTCSPPVPMPCAAIPSGTSIPITLLDGTMTLAGGTADIAQGAEWLLLADVDSSNTPILRAGPLKPQYRCADITL